MGKIVLCEWCHRRPAVIKAYRTFYADTEFEQTSSYFECEECARKSNADVTGIGD